MRPPDAEEDADPDSAPGIDEATARSPRFPALQHRNFRLFWSGNLISLVGTLAQQTALAWLMRTLTPDPLLISQIAACGSFPILFFTLPAGVLADRVDKRRALVMTNAVSFVLALLLAALVHLKLIQIWHIALIAFCVGTVNAFDIPIRQSFNVEMVGRDNLPNAIALNSSAFNSARVAGPMVGGLLLNVFSMAGCFLVNAISFLPLIGNLCRMDTPPVKGPTGRVRLADMKAGFAWVKQHETLRLVTVLVAFVSLTAMSFSTLLPIFARDIWHSNERGFSLLATCNGLGAMGAAVTLAVFGRMTHKGKRLLLGAALFCASVIAFAFSPSLPFGCFWLVLAGWFLLTFLMTANTLVQTLSPDDLRGRIFSLYSLALIGTSPLGALLVGAMARVLGTQHAVATNAALACAFILAVWFRFRRLWKER